jgi:replication factor C subunit 2/4
LLGLLPRVTTDDLLSERHKAELAIRMAEAEKNMVDGADEFLQLMTVCSLAYTCLQQAKAASASN